MHKDATLKALLGALVGAATFGLFATHAHMRCDIGKSSTFGQGPASPNTGLLRRTETASAPQKLHKARPAPHGNDAPAGRPRARRMPPPHVDLSSLPQGSAPLGFISSLLRRPKAATGHQKLAEGRPEPLAGGAAALEPRGARLATPRPRPRPSGRSEHFQADPNTFSQSSFPTLFFA